MVDLDCPFGLCALSFRFDFSFFSGFLWSDIIEHIQFDVLWIFIVFDDLVACKCMN